MSQFFHGIFLGNKLTVIYQIDNDRAQGNLF